MSTIHLRFSSQLITSNFSSKPVFLQFFTWIAIGDVDLLLSLILVTKANAVEKAATGTTCIYHQHHQSIHVTDGVVTVMTVSASLLQKIGVTMERLCQIMLNRKLSRKFERLR
jgi:hypothetical protein